MRFRKPRTSSAVRAALEGSLNTVLNEGNERAEAALRHNQSWGIVEADRWHYDQDAGLLTFTFSDRVMEAPFQFLGSYDSSSGTWMWAWANRSIDPALKADSLELQTWGKSIDEPVLTEPLQKVSLEDADCMALVALATSRYDAIYKAPDGDQVAYLSFGQARPR